MTSHGDVAAVSARGLEKRFGAVAALKGVDLEIPRGHLLAILGPNAAGKSTLVRILAGLTRPTAGEVRLADADSRDRHSARAQIGFVGHATLLYPELTARENLVFTGRMHGVHDPASRAAALLREEGLEDFADRRTQTFSRGLAQRLSIARAQVHDPPVLLLDEPFSGLDGPSAERLARRLGELRDAGRSIALVTHDLRPVRDLCDSLLVLVAGRVAYRAPRSELAGKDLDSVYRSLTEDAS